jgi:hypothetical protein
MKRFWVYYMFRHLGIGEGYPIKTTGYGKTSDEAIQWVKDYQIKYSDNCTGFSAELMRQTKW